MSRERRGAFPVSFPSPFLKTSGNLSMPRHSPLYVPMLANDLVPPDWLFVDGMKKASGIALIDPMQKALFIRRADTGVWEFPGGHQEDGEKPEETATRELQEETGYTIDGAPSEWGRDNSYGFDYTTFKHNVAEQFAPTLNEESTEFRWAPLAQPPEPLHPGVSAILEAGYTAERGNDQAFAFDYASVQMQDADGRLHVTSANITKANICPYLGAEIPGAEELGLDLTKVYYLLRDPDELAKAAASFNNIPILDEHLPHSSADPQQEKTIGTTGSEAIFVYPYLRNSLAFWVEGPIEEIKAKTRRELSSSYRYRADMTPGTWNGARYDGVMRDIIANHVALVKEGRAGSDVIVGDSKRKGLILMTTKTKIKIKMSPIGLITQGVLMHAFGGGVLAVDSKLDIAKYLTGLTKKNFAAKKQGIADALTKDAKPMLATDAALPDLITLLDAVEKVEAIDEVTPLMTAPPAGSDEPIPFKGKPETGAEDEDDDDDKKKKKADDADEDDDKKKKADDADEDEKKKEKADDKMGKDAVNKLVKDAVAQAKAEQVAIREAEKFVRPWVGDLAMAYDSAAGVHKAALDVLGVDVDGVHESAFKKIIEMQPKPGEVRRAHDTADELAMDEAGQASFHKRFPGAERIRTV